MMFLKRLLLAGIMIFSACSCYKPPNKRENIYSSPVEIRYWKGPFFNDEEQKSAFRELMEDDTEKASKRRERPGISNPQDFDPNKLLNPTIQKSTQRNTKQEGPEATTYLGVLPKGVEEESSISPEERLAHLVSKPIIENDTEEGRKQYNDSNDAEGRHFHHNNGHRSYGDGRHFDDDGNFHFHGERNFDDRDNDDRHRDDDRDEHDSENYREDHGDRHSDEDDEDRDIRHDHRHHGVYHDNDGNSRGHFTRHDHDDKEKEYRDKYDTENRQGGARNSYQERTERNFFKPKRSKNEIDQQNSDEEEGQRNFFEPNRDKQEIERLYHSLFKKSKVPLRHIKHVRKAQKSLKKSNIAMLKKIKKQTMSHAPQENILTFTNVHNKTFGNSSLKKNETLQRAPALDYTLINKNKTVTATNSTRKSTKENKLNSLNSMNNTNLSSQHNARKLISSNSNRKSLFPDVDEEIRQNTMIGESQPEDIRYNGHQGENFGTQFSEPYYGSQHNGNEGYSKGEYYGIDAPDQHDNKNTDDRDSIHSLHNADHGTASFTDELTTNIGDDGDITGHHHDSHWASSVVMKFLGPPTHPEHFLDDTFDDFPENGGSDINHNVGDDEDLHEILESAGHHESPPGEHQAKDGNQARYSEQLDAIRNIQDDFNIDEEMDRFAIGMALNNHGHAGGHYGNHGIDHTYDNNYHHSPPFDELYGNSHKKPSFEDAEHNTNTVPLHSPHNFDDSQHGADTPNDVSPDSLPLLPFNNHKTENHGGHDGGYHEKVSPYHASPDNWALVPSNYHNPTGSFDRNDGTDHGKTPPLRTSPETLPNHINNDKDGGKPPSQVESPDGLPLFPFNDHDTGSYSNHDGDGEHYGDNPGHEDGTNNHEMDATSHSLGEASHGLPLQAIPDTHEMSPEEYEKHLDHVMANFLPDAHLGSPVGDHKVPDEHHGINGFVPQHTFTDNGTNENTNSEHEFDKEEHKYDDHPFVEANPNGNLFAHPADHGEAHPNHQHDANHPASDEPPYELLPHENEAYKPSDDQHGVEPSEESPEESYNFHEEYEDHLQHFLPEVGPRISHAPTTSSENNPTQSLQQQGNPMQGNVPTNGGPTEGVMGGGAQSPANGDQGAVGGGPHGPMGGGAPGAVDSGPNGAVGGGTNGAMGSGAPGAVGGGAHGPVGGGPHDAVGGGAPDAVSGGLNGAVGGGTNGAMGSGAPGAVGGGHHGAMGGGAHGPVGGGPHGAVGGGPHRAVSSGPHGTMGGGPNSAVGSGAPGAMGGGAPGAVGGGAHGAVGGGPHGAMGGSTNGAVGGGPNGAVDGGPHGAMGGGPHGAMGGGAHGPVGGGPHGAMGGGSNGAVGSGAPGAVGSDPNGAAGGGPPGAMGGGAPGAVGDGSHGAMGGGAHGPVGGGPHGAVGSDPNGAVGGGPPGAMGGGAPGVVGDGSHSAVGGGAHGPVGGGPHGAIGGGPNGAVGSGAPGAVGSDPNGAVGGGPPGAMGGGAPGAVGDGSHGAMGGGAHGLVGGGPHGAVGGTGSILIDFGQIGKQLSGSTNPVGNNIHGQAGHLIYPSHEPIEGEEEMDLDGAIEKQHGVSHHGAMEQQSNIGSHGPTGQQGMAANGAMGQKQGMSANGAMGQKQGMGANGAMGQKQGMGANGAMGQKQGMSANGAMGQKQGMGANGAMGQKQGMSANGAMEQKQGMGANGATEQKQGMGANGAMGQKQGMGANGAMEQKQGMGANGAMGQKQGMGANGAMGQKQGMGANGAMGQKQGMSANGAMGHKKGMGANAVMGYKQGISTNGAMGQKQGMSATGDMGQQNEIKNAAFTKNSVSSYSTGESDCCSTVVTSCCRDMLSSSLINEGDQVLSNNQKESIKFTTTGQEKDRVSSNRFKGVIKAFKMLNISIPASLEIAELKAEIQELKHNDIVTPESPVDQNGSVKDKTKGNKKKGHKEPKQAGTPNGAAEVTKLIQQMGNRAVEADASYAPRYQRLQQLNLEQQSLLKQMLENAVKIINGKPKLLKKPDREQYTVETILNTGHESDPGVQEAQLVSLLHNMQRAASDATADYWDSLKNRKHPQPNANVNYFLQPQKTETTENSDAKSELEVDGRVKQPVTVELLDKGSTNAGQSVEVTKEDVDLIKTLNDSVEKKIKDVKNAKEIETKKKQTPIEDIYADLGFTGAAQRSLTAKVSKKRNAGLKKSGSV